MERSHVSVIGAGAFGTAIAHVLACAGQWVCLYTHEADVAVTINQTHQNKAYLPNTDLPATVWATTCSERAAQAEVIFVAIPVPYLSTSLASFSPYISPSHTVCVLSKGVQADTGILAHELVGQTVGVCRLAALSGPNFAADLVKGGLSGALIASRKSEVALQVAQLFDDSNLRVTVSSDIVGVQLCGALKNIIALGCGLLAGQGASDNTRAYFMCQALQEVTTIVRAAGGAARTVSGLAGLGDTVLSSLATQGRNYRLGVMLGKKEPLAQSVASFASPPEGLNTARALTALLQRYQIDAPLLRKVAHAVLYSEHLRL